MKRMIAEFEKQSFTQVLFPHVKTDWAEYLQEAEATFVQIIQAIQTYQKCFVICADITYVKSKFQDHTNLYFADYETDDTWARDISCLSVEDDAEVKLLDFTFNAWGNKFEWGKDNAMSVAMQNIYLSDIETIPFVLEGGAVESNGSGILLTTSTCMLNKNRNPQLTSIEITKKLNETLGCTTVLYLEHGYLAGDDTDAHIDTLARFIDAKTIMYVACENEEDEHYKELLAMKKELQTMAKEHDLNLIPLPFPHAIYENKERLPATYANFLFVNGAVLVPTYNVPEDKLAIDIFINTFTSLDILPINCTTLIKQHGSLHCVTMNFASGVTLLI
ncbi:agmatine deiminase family protein [Sulfurimonas sp. SAG-AH-194-I05]|nr:agmatine deiminase family protein [Sulfurimonas sp. SAG-AH-194-I05]MDF1874270.1 agmatine deiminase family protein [Sulfurimonas sp. SAG-AH-194-I05]